MEIVNLLDFLNNAKELHAPEFSVCSEVSVNFLDIITDDEQLTQKINMGIIYVSQRTIDQFTVVDGLNRIISLSLLLHAICECYKKTSAKNEKAIKTIRTKYLLDGLRTKLRLNSEMQEVYNKIIFGEKLSGKEKESPLFILLHKFWVQIKEEELHAANIFKILDKITVFLVDASDVPARDLYYALNRNKFDLNHFLLIENYLSSLGIYEEWKQLNNIFINEADLKLFFRDYFITRFNFKNDAQLSLYNVFQNYFETMLQYMDAKNIITKILHSAHLYSDILNININNENIKHAMIQIKIHNGEDTYAYLLSIYEDYIDNNITEATLLEILSTIDEYLVNRLKTPNNVSFNELIHYLNAFITCK